MPKSDKEYEKYLRQIGLEPDVIDGLKESQKDYKALGMDMTLQQVADMELDWPEDEEDEE